MRIRNYELGQELGRGTFGVTYLADDIVNKRRVAIKTIDIEKSKQLGASMNSIQEEISTLRDINGNKCNKYMACYYESFIGDLRGIPSVFIVSEYIEGGSLTAFIQKYPGNSLNLGKISWLRSQFPQNKLDFFIGGGIILFYVIHYTGFFYITRYNKSGSTALSQQNFSAQGCY